jgi:trimethylamine-N-oxide reductase (cytochrome c)
LKKEQEKLPVNEEQKQSGEVTRRDFLVGAGTVVVGGAIGAGLLSSCNGGETVTTTVEKTKTVTTTLAGSDAVTVTSTTTIQGGTAGATITSTKTVTEGIVDEGEVQTFIRAHSLGSFSAGGDPVAVDVKNGKIIRIRPLHWNQSYSDEELQSSMWSYETRGKKFGPLEKACPSYFALSYKKEIYSPNRVRYPLKRIDWDPDGERNTQNRGKSKYKRISWDEATNTIASEIVRIQEKYGSYAILCQGDGHGESKAIHGPHGYNQLLMSMAGGYTLSVRNADTWEGWYWGSMHVWGTMSNGQMSPSTNIGKDIMDNCDMILHWAGDRETVRQQSTQAQSRRYYWLTDVGIKNVWICPDFTYSAGVHADKWIPVVPGADSALQLAMAYIWIDEDTYDKDYVETHTEGFDTFKAYVMGDEDGIPKNPAWATKRCGVPLWTIKALARQTISKVTTIAHGISGNFIRGPYSHEPGRLECCLLAMMGLGKPGIHQACNAGHLEAPSVEGPRLSSPGWRSNLFSSLTPQIVPKPLFAESILDRSWETWGSSLLGAAVDDQFIKYVYPLPEDEGGAEIHMVWTDTPCLTVCWNDAFRTIEAFRDSKVEFVLAQHPWLQDDVLMADIIMPGTTMFEESDIISGGRELSCYCLQNKCVDSIGESKSDYEIVGEIAKKLEEYGGDFEGLYERFIGGRTVEEWREYSFQTNQNNYNSKGMDFPTWEEFKEKQYWLPPLDPNWESLTVGLSKFYENPTDNPLATPTGKLEIYSQRLADAFPDDKERGPYPKYMIGGSENEGWNHDESLDVENGAERCKTYPLLIVSNHPRWRHHACCDDNAWLREMPTSKIKGYDGYMYEPLWINPVDAEARGIENGDIVKIYNERGIVLGGAYVTQRIKAGAVYQDHGARIDLITTGIDRAGSNNLISCTNTVSKNCAGMSTTSFLVEVEKLDPRQMEEWRKAYPEAFARAYDLEYGSVFSSWVEGETS